LPLLLPSLHFTSLNFTLLLLYFYFTFTFTLLLLYFYFTFTLLLLYFYFTFTLHLLLLLLLLLFYFTFTGIALALLYFYFTLLVRDCVLYPIWPNYPRYLSPHQKNRNMIYKPGFKLFTVVFHILRANIHWRLHLKLDSSTTNAPEFT
jgi:hypothetical protein